jgi:hypothetical protein
VTFGLVLLVDPFARPAWRTAGPWVMALAFLAVIAPNAWWLVDSGFLPFQYVSARAKEAAHWYEYLLFPLQWTGSQIFFLLPAIALLGLLYSGIGWAWRPRSVSTSTAVPTRRPLPQAIAARAAFERRYLAALALGPFVLTTLVAALLGRLPVAMWGYPLWSFAPLAAIAWFGPVEDTRALRRLAGGIIAVSVGFAVVYAAIELFEPLLRSRGKATQFPGAAMAARLTQDWHDRFGVPLAYVCGDAFIANNVAVYSTDRPHVLVNCDTRLSPWIDPADLRRRGALVVWEVDPGQAAREGWHSALGDLDGQPAFTLSRLTLRPVPVRIESATIAPQP